MAKKKRKRKAVHKTNPNGGKELRKRITLFYNRLLEICEAIGARELMEQLPFSERVLIYQFRTQPIKLKPMEHVSFDPIFLKAIRKLLDEHFLSKKTYTLPCSTLEISFRDYFLYVLTLTTWYRTLDRIDILPYEQLGKKLKPLLDQSNKDGNPEKELMTFLSLVGSGLTKQPYKLSYYFELKTEFLLNPAPCMGIYIMLKAVKASVKMVKFGSDKRETFLVTGWQEGSLRKAWLSAESINSNTMLAGMRFDVYMQKHALNRLIERLDIFQPTELYAHVAMSIENAEVVASTPNKGLLRYYYYGYPLGYFVVELAEGVAVFRTFLFLTNDGTPEGKQLSKILGVNKLDKKYTKLDRMSSFVHEDLKKDSKLYEILCEAGCGILLNLDHRLLKQSAKKDVDFDVSALKKYLELEEA